MDLKVDRESNLSGSAASRQHYHSDYPDNPGHLAGNPRKGARELASLLDPVRKSSWVCHLERQRDDALPVDDQ
jgi:hypothetical protein